MSFESGFFMIRLNESLIRAILNIVKLFVSGICCSIFDFYGIYISSRYSVSVLTNDEISNMEPGLLIS
jgi:hypothetical protein